MKKLLLLALSAVLLSAGRSQAQQQAPRKEVVCTCAQRIVQEPMRIEERIVYKPVRTRVIARPVYVQAVPVRSVVQVAPACPRPWMGFNFGFGGGRRSGSWFGFNFGI